MEKEMMRFSDLGQAAALITDGFKLKGISRDENGRAYFLFEDEPYLDHIAGTYWDDGLGVDARQYFENIKMLKGRIYAGK